MNKILTTLPTNYPEYENLLEVVEVEMFHENLDREFARAIMKQTVIKWELPELKELQHRLHLRCAVSRMAVDVLIEHKKDMY